jgi:hypothetical protein
VAQGVGDVRVAVERGEHQPGPGGGLGGQQRIDLGGQPLPVGQAGEPVVVAVVADLAEQLLLPDGGVDVREHRLQGAAVALGEGHDVALPVADLQVAGLAGGGGDGCAQHLAGAAALQRGRLVAVRAVGGQQHRAGHPAGHGALAEQVVGVAGPVVPGQVAVGGVDHQLRPLVEVGRQPQRDPVGVEQLADGADDLAGAGLVGGDHLDPAGEVVDPLHRAPLPGRPGGHPEDADEAHQQRDDERPAPRGPLGDQQRDHADDDAAERDRDVGQRRRPEPPAGVAGGQGDRAGHADHADQLEHQDGQHQGQPGGGVGQLQRREDREHGERGAHLGDRQGGVEHELRGRIALPHHHHGQRGQPGGGGPQAADLDEPHDQRDLGGGGGDRLLAQLEVELDRLGEQEGQEEDDDRQHGRRRPGTRQGRDTDDRGHGDREQRDRPWLS